MSDPQPPGSADPNVPPPYGAPPSYGRPPQYGAPPSYGQPPPYGAPPAYQGGGYGGMIPGQAPGDPAPMGMRLLARIIDAIIVGVVAVLIANLAGIHLFHHEIVINNGVRTREFRFSAAGGDFVKFALVQLLVSGLYEVSLLTLRGATLGKMAVGVKVVQLESRELPNVTQAATRWVIPAILGLVPVAGFLLEIVLFISPFFDPTKRNRGWYDMAAKTIAIRAR